jgi:uncharacterized protein (TIGR02594 family)
MNNLQYNTRKLLPSEAMNRLASQYIGLQEIEGGEDNPIIVQWFKDIGHWWVKDDETAWCSCFINWLAWMTGVEMSGKLDARSWLRVGQSVNFPHIGDVVVFWREHITSWKGHVGLFNGYDHNGNIIVLGGNQGNEVCYSVYDKDRLLDFRRLSYDNQD